MTQPRAASLPVLLLGVVCGAIGCERATTAPRGAYVRYFMQTVTAEGGYARHLLAVGDTGFGYFYEQCGPSGDLWPCVAPAYGLARSSDTNVVAVQPLDAPAVLVHSVRLVGRAPGSAVVSFTKQDTWRDSVRVEVVAEPLPVDSVRVKSNPCCTGLVSAAKDTAGNLISLTVSVQAKVELHPAVFRGGHWMVYLPGTVTSSDTTVTGVSCRAGAYGVVATQLWGCIIGANTDLGVTGLSPGSATVTVTARNQQYSFLVTVQ